MTKTMWNFGDILDTIGEVNGDNDPALIHGDRVITWPQMTSRSNNMAKALRKRGADDGDKVGFYLRNQPEYMEGAVACFKGRLTHVNINYRYLEEELMYIFDNSDAVAAFYDVEFRENVERIHERLPKVKIWVEVGGDGNTPHFAVSYEELANEGDGKPLNIERSGDDLLFQYTGGTTGMPKGVMWPHKIWRQASIEGTIALTGAAPMTMEEHIASVKEAGRLVRQMPACPLMHATGLFTALGALLNGGAVVTLETSHKFDAEELWQTVEKNGVTSIAIVGDVFAKPLIKILDANPGRFNLSSMQMMVSSGVMWSMDVKRKLIDHIPQVALMDSFGASEAVGFGSSVTTAEGVSETAKFVIGGHCKVFKDGDVEVKPGSGETGFIARGGAVPLGYYKDEKKTAETFKTINGVRYSIPGDLCTVEEDGTITLLGRGSICINSGGEKIYPEEVEEALKEHPSVRDALVVGVVDEQWGQAVTAIVSLDQDVPETEVTLKAFVRTKLAAYKAPKRVLVKEDLARAPNGKADYKGIKAFALAELGVAE